MGALGLTWSRSIGMWMSFMFEVWVFHFADARGRWEGSILPFRKILLSYGGGVIYIRCYSIYFLPCRTFYGFILGVIWIKAKGDRKHVWVASQGRHQGIGVRTTDHRTVLANSNLYNESHLLSI